MPPPIASTPTRRREAGWRDSHSHHGHRGLSYPGDYDVMSPNPYGSASSMNRGPRPPAPGSASAPYHYDPQGPPMPSRGPPGPPPGDYWYASPPPYNSEHPHPHPHPHAHNPPPPSNHRGGGAHFWGPPPPSLHDGYRGGPSHESLRGAPNGHTPHPNQHPHRTPPRRPYPGDQVGLSEPTISPSSSGEHHSLVHHHQRKDFSPPSPPGATGRQAPGNRGVQVSVSASADSEEATTLGSSSAAANTVTPNKGGRNDASDAEDAEMGDGDSGSKQGTDKKGDPLRVLADVSAGMGGKNKNKNKSKNKQSNRNAPEPTGETTGGATNSREGSDAETAASATSSPSAAASRPSVPMPAPTSPLHRRFKPSPITPSQTPQVRAVVDSKRTPATTRKHQPITPSRSHDTASTAETSGPQPPLQMGWEPPPLPHGGSGSSGSGEMFPAHPAHEQYSNASQQAGPYRPSAPRRNGRPAMHYGGPGEFGQPAYPADSPALVERGSFDSHGDASTYRGASMYPPPSTPNSSRGAYFYDDHPPPPPGYGSGAGAGPHWENPGQSPYSPSYPPPGRGAGGWNPPHPPPPHTHSDPYYAPPPHHGPPPPEYSYPPPPPHYGGPEDHDLPFYGGTAPPLHPSYHHRGGPPLPMPGPHHPGMPIPPPHMMGGPPPPYHYGHPPRMEEKTILRKKFSWKHYPELERFLIANRDEYLKHSNMNYTAEQKQYNNWLTERLLEVAGQHNYMFDPDDFNFVAIRDRIRCYYKSYVQTARKRGLKLPEKKALKNKIAAATTEGSGKKE
ncbi:unnamed protein product [Pseudo-nitzschia multistriata]|uniref:Uncharacterized protein n=1 Tax=Pseudo-nitzschia multistriata TaxID=183589 RepID=A0A448ZEL4_9STRA|nr:unnamed protein product [Pseudo-nitzschia multistriata]